MDEFKRTRFWRLRYPQLAVVVAMVCLLVGGLGAASRARPLPPIPAAQQPTLSQTEKTAISCAAVPCLALTFDDGPSSVNTPVVLDILAREHAKATFFVVGRRVHGNGPILQRMHADGHEIGNHTWSHPKLTDLSPAEVRLQIETTQTAVLEAGVPVPRLLRPPYGATNVVVETQVPLTIVRWNIDPLDWTLRDSDALAERIVAQARPGGILLLHDTHPHVAGALAKALPQLRAQYQLVTVSELLGLTGGDQGQYFSR